MDVSRRAFLLAGLAGLATTAAGCSTDDAPPAGSASTTTPNGPSGTGSAGHAGSSTTAAPPITGPDGRIATAAKGPAAFVDRGVPDSDKVALTFHTDGDVRLAQQVLAVFAEKDAVMTNFVVGRWLALNPAWAAKLEDGGHELANHTQTHPDFAALDEAAMAREIGQCRDILAEFAGHAGRYFRPSGTDDGTARPSDAILTAAGKAGYATVLGWNVEPFDYRDPGADAVRTRVLDEVAGGSIVSLHFGHAGTIAALPAILDGIASRGLRTVTVSDLLS